jgi:hypothetical protein
MRGEVAALFKEMELACRCPLFVGIGTRNSTTTEGRFGSTSAVGVTTSIESASIGYPESETGSSLSIPKNGSFMKRNYSDSLQLRSWQEVS